MLSRSQSPQIWASEFRKNVTQIVEVQADTASTRERILAAARKIFLDGPPELATMDALAQEAGMSKKTIYREFKSQFDLLAVLACETVQLSEPQPPPTARSDIELELYMLVSRIVVQITAPRSMALARLLLSEVRRYPELAQQPRPPGAPREVIANWLNSPSVRSRYAIGDADEAAAMLLGMVLQDTAFKALLPGMPPVPQHVLEERARRAVSIFLKGVAKLPR